MAVKIAVVLRPLKLSLQLQRASVANATYQRIAVTIAADSRGNCCGLTSAEIAVAIAVGFRGLPWLAPRSLPRTEPWRVPWSQPWHLPWKRHEPWPLPWKPADFHGSPWQHLRKSTDVSRSLPRTSTKKSNNVHPCSGSSWCQAISVRVHTVNKYGEI